MRAGVPHNHGLPESVLSTPELVPMADGQPFLTDVQYEALEAGVARGESVLVSAPTSTGKTLIGWWTIASAVAAGGRAVYLVSHRALAKQKFEEAQRLFLNGLLGGDQSVIVCATGDGVEDASGRKTNAPLAANILVATYEKFLGSLSAGGPPKDLTDTCIVCDEVQLIGDPHRGRNVELLLTLLRRSGWRQMVALSAVMGDVDAQSLSDWLQLRLVRNPAREKALRIECRSPTSSYEVAAAPSRSGDIVQLAVVKERETNGIVNELLRNPALGPVIVFCMKVDDTYELCSEWTQGKAVAKMVAAPPGVELDVGLKRALERRAAFHNAELSEDERLFIENQLATGEVDVVYASSTLAAGVNFPLGSAIFATWKRWNFERGRAEPISRAEFQNMAGRVGRMGQAAAEGLVVLCADGAASVTQATHLMNLSDHDELGAGIVPDDFGSLTLQLFAGRMCANRRDAFELIASTLSAERERMRNRSGVEHWEPILNRQIDRLISAGCLIEGRSQIAATSFGISVARSGLKPETAIYFIDGLTRSGANLANMLPSADLPGNEDDLLFILTHAALTSPEFNSEGGSPTRSVSWRVSRPNLVANDYARRLDQLLWELPWAANVSAANGALILTGWAAGRSRTDIEALIPGVRLGTVEALARDVSWILTGISEIISDATSPTLADESKPEALRGQSVEVQSTRKLARGMRRQATRVAAGLPSDVLWMTSLELRGARRQLSRNQILSLRHQGLTRPHELMDGGHEADQRRRLAIVAADGSFALANQVREAARNWKMVEREHFRKAHRRRATKLGIDEIIEALHTTRGHELERAFESAMGMIAVGCQQLDSPQRQAYPDFLVTIENLPPVVVEIKSRANDTDLVSLNSATEVLAASELIGMRGNFCLTVCSPGVEPNVPGIIESCGRLCVVDISDLTEALLRIREGTLTRDGLFNWLTTPGIALREDLPHPQ